MNPITEHINEKGQVQSVGRALDNARKVWAKLDVIKKDNPELGKALEKVKSTKVVPEHLAQALSRRGTTPLAIVQTLSEAREKAIPAEEMKKQENK